LVTAGRAKAGGSIARSPFTADRQESDRSENSKHYLLMLLCLISIISRSRSWSVMPFLCWKCAVSFVFRSQRKALRHKAPGK